MRSTRRSSCARGTLPRPELTVVGSINLDLVANAERLPRPGQTVTGARFSRYPGGKGANQAVAAARLGAAVRMVGAVGEDPTAEEAIAGLREADVDLDLQRSPEPTGVALITVDAEGETTIVVAPGANRNRKLEGRPVEGAVLCQLEIPDEPVLAAARDASFFCLNAAPARPIDAEPDLLVVNRYEHEVNSRGKLVALTLGAEGAACSRTARRLRGRRHRRSTRSTERRRATRSPPASSSRTSRAAPGTKRCGVPARPARSRPPGPAPSRRFRPPTRWTRSLAERIILDCDPGHDDAIALLLALASPEVELLGVTTVAGNQTLEKTTANAIRILEFAGRTEISVAAGADRPIVREPYVAKYVHGETGLDGPDLPPAQGSPLEEHAVDFLGRHADGATLVAVGPLTNVALMLARYPEARPERIVLMGGSIGLGNVTPAAEFNIWADPEAAARVFESGLDVTMIGLDVTHQALMTSADAERLRRTGRTGTLVAELWAFYNRFHPRRTGSTARRSTTPWPSRTSSVRISSRPSTATSRSTAAPSSAVAGPWSTCGGAPRTSRTPMWAWGSRAARSSSSCTSGSQASDEKDPPRSCCRRRALQLSSV